MNVSLITCTPSALDVLLRTKNTRLGFSEDPSTWSDEKRAEHLAYMRDTIRSSWEFVDYIFEFDGVSRAFTHQLVRTRSGSYAQESQRTVDVRGHQLLLPKFKTALGHYRWDRAVREMIDAYGEMIDAGEDVQEARGILPTNICTSIFAKFNLRTLSDMAKTRLCTRTQGEYQTVFRRMRELVLEVHPWTEEFIQVHCVATGTCAFPRYGKTGCKFYDPRMDMSEVIAVTRARFWSEGQEAANPIAREGKTS